MRDVVIGNINEMLFFIYLNYYDFFFCVNNYVGCDFYLIFIYCSDIKLMYYISESENDVNNDK